MLDFSRVVLILVALPAYARGSGGGSGNNAGILGAIGAGFGLLLILLRALFTDKPKVTHPDGSTEEAAPRVPAAEVPPVKSKRQIGSTTVSFSQISERHAMVNNLKQRFGSAVRIVHRGQVREWDVLFGNKTIYTLIYEVPVKCPSCKETFGIEDFGEVDCPSCGAGLAVYFDPRLHKKAITIADASATTGAQRAAR